MPSFDLWLFNRFEWFRREKVIQEVDGLERRIRWRGCDDHDFYFRHSFPRQLTKTTHLHMHINLHRNKIPNHTVDIWFRLSIAKINEFIWSTGEMNTAEIFRNTRKKKFTDTLSTSQGNESSAQQEKKENSASEREKEKYMHPLEQIHDRSPLRKKVCLPFLLLIVVSLIVCLSQSKSPSSIPPNAPSFLTASTIPLIWLKPTRFHLKSKSGYGPPWFRSCAR